MFLYRGQTELSAWQNYSLIVPAISVGNVGQLSADLLISTLLLDRAGFILDETVTPVVGNGPFSTQDASENCQLATSCEVYESSRFKVVVVQMRAPAIQGRRKDFTTNLLNWATKYSFKEIIVLGSTHAFERVDSQISGSQFRYLLSPACDDSLSTVFSEKFQWKKLERREPQPAASLEFDDADDEARKVPSKYDDLFIPGGGFCKLMYMKCSEDSSLPPLVELIVFCTEGDNAPDALLLTTHLNKWKEFLPIPARRDPTSIWRIPSSWKLQFGNTFTPLLF